MFKNLFTRLCITLMLVQPISLYGNNINLPDIGTAAVTTLSVGQEVEMGDYYTRLLRSSAPIINDPILNEYINLLGHRLVTSADSVQTPFQFYIMQSDVLNAFAYFGGNVVIHSRLILDTDTEGQLASVMSHEIGHVTQRHLARAMEERNNNSPYVWGAALGSLLLALANPEAGMAALTGTMAGSVQSQISFTQSNEQEADRVGLRIMARAGFDPHSSSEFLQKLSDQARYMSKPPEMLLTHPLPDSRLSDVRNRVNQYSRKEVESSLDYYLAKMRLTVFFGNNENNTKLLLEAYQKLNTKSSNIALQYGNALIDYQAKDYNKARSTLQPLLEVAPNNRWFIDLMTDIDLSSGRAAQAIKRIEAALKAESSNHVLTLNLANAYIENKEYQKAISLLHRFTYSHSQDLNGWDLLITAYSKIRSRGQEMAAKAEILALQGQLPQAIRLLQNAKEQVNNDQILQSRITARVVQLQTLESRFKAYQQ